MNEITKQVGNLDLIENWKPVANGVWKSEIGDMNSEKRYISLAAEAPRLDRINGLSPTGFPFENCMPSYQDKDGKITEKTCSHGTLKNRISKLAKICVIS